ncbi:MAG: GNAT family N-acetyltransferase [Candidatus Zixiibacteriota bacterium]|nr:MAG: GNAT family N-acetyltransferase [candidate division Zixibacteria bacterium]
MQLLPFTEELVPLWQQAVDNTDCSPSPLGGPEFNSTTIRGWGKTFVFMANGLMIPVARSETTHFRMVKSAVYTGVSVNSLLGITQMNDQVWTDLARLPRRCVILLDIPEEHYCGNEEKWQALDFHPSERIAYHKIDVPASYDEWFSRPNVKRYNVRAAQRKGLTVTFGGAELSESFYQVYLLSYSRWKDRQTASKPHSLARIQRLMEMLPDSLARIATVNHEGQVIAGAIFSHYHRTGGYLYGGIDYAFRELKANNLLHAEIIRYLIDKGVSEYNLGTSLNLKDLEHFKETLGASRHLSVTLCRDRFPRLKRLLHKGSVS